MGTKSSSLFEFALLSRHIQPKHFGCFFFSFNFFSFRLSRCVFSFYLFIYLLCRFAFAFRCCRRRHHRRRRRRHFCCSSNCYSAILSLFLLLFGGLSRAICILFLFSHFKSFVLTYSSFFSVVFFFFLPLFSFQCSAFLHFSIVVDVCVCECVDSKYSQCFQFMETRDATYRHSFERGNFRKSLLIESCLNAFKSAMLWLPHISRVYSMFMPLHSSDSDKYYRCCYHLSCSLSLFRPFKYNVS